MASDLIRETPGGRFYEIDGLLYVSVTNVIDSLTDLEDWTATEAAKAAVDNLPALIASLLEPECGRTWAGHKSHPFDMPCTALCPCGRCTRCVCHQLANAYRQIKARRAKEGSEFHDYKEHWILSNGRVKIKVRPEVRPYVDAFVSVCEDYGLTAENWIMCEAVAFNPDHGYAGTTDGALRIYARATTLAAELVASVLDITIESAIAGDRHVDVMEDVKTKEKPLVPGRGPKLYPAHALQLAAYLACPKIQIKGTTHFAQMPPLDGAVVIQLRPDGGTMRPVDAGPKTFAAFLDQKNISTWVREDGTAAVSVRTFKPAKPVKVTRPRKKVVAINPDPTPEQAAATVKRDTQPRKSAAFSLAGQPGLSDDEIPF